MIFKNILLYLHSFCVTHMQKILHCTLIFLLINLNIGIKEILLILALVYFIEDEMRRNVIMKFMED